MPRDLPSPPSPSADPFLAQTRNLPLSDRERQEGYDMDLVHSRPRGHRGAMGSQPSPTAGAGAAGFGAGAGAGAYEMRESRPSLASGGRSYSNNLNGGLTGAGTAGMGEKYGDSTSRGIAAADEPPTRRKWFLRTPAVIVLGLLLLLAFALAIGLGVGLGVARRKSSSDAVSSNSTTSSTLTSSHASGATSGTVIPSSLSSLFTTPRLSTSSGASTTTSLATAATTTSTSGIIRFTSPLVSPSSQFVTSDAVTEGGALTETTIATAVATTGNLPIPAESSTTIVDASGTHTISALPDTTMRKLRR